LQKLGRSPWTQIQGTAQSFLEADSTITSSCALLMVTAGHDRTSRRRHPTTGNNMGICFLPGQPRAYHSYAVSARPVSHELLQTASEGSTSDPPRSLALTSSLDLSVNGYPRDKSGHQISHSIAYPSPDKDEMAGVKQYFTYTPSNQGESAISL